MERRDHGLFSVLKRFLEVLTFLMVVGAVAYILAAIVMFLLRRCVPKSISHGVWIGAPILYGLGMWNCHWHWSQWALLVILLGVGLNHWKAEIESQN